MINRKEKWKKERWKDNEKRVRQLQCEEEEEERKGDRGKNKEVNMERKK